MYVVELVYVVEVEVLDVFKMIPKLHSSYCQKPDSSE
jgi:hypothetical protein